MATLMMARGTTWTGPLRVIAGEVMSAGVVVGDVSLTSGNATNRNYLFADITGSLHVQGGTNELLEELRVTGTLTIEPRATVPGGGAVDRFVLYVDGVRVTECGSGGTLTLDTTVLADGHHDLRVVGIEMSSVETQGRQILPVFFRNRDRTLEIDVEPRQVSRSGSVRITVRGTGIDGAVVFATGRVLGRTTGSESAIEVPAELLGRGSVTVRATGRGGSSPADGVNAAPVVVEVTE